MAGAVVAAVCFTLPLVADNPPAPAANAPAVPLVADPFVKKGAPVPADATGPQASLIFTYEFYQLGQAEGARLLQGDATDEERYGQLRDLVKQGKARLDALLCGAVADGNQVNLEQYDVVAFPIAYFIPTGAKTVSAADFKKRNLGYRLVLKVQTTNGNKACDISMFPEHTRLRGFVDRSSWDGAVRSPLPSRCSNPAREHQATAPSLRSDSFDKHLQSACGRLAPPNKPQLPEPVKDPEMGLMFAHASRLQYDPGAAIKPKPYAVNLELSTYSMDRDQALRLLGQTQHPGSAYEAVQSLVKANQAKLEHLSVIRTADSIKSNCSEVFEDIYPTGGNDQWITQDVGFSAEVRPHLIGNGNVINLDVTQYQFMKDIGPLQAPGLFGTLVAAQPMFELQSIVTNINAAVGEHALLGTVNPAGDTGLPGTKDDGRVWLAFIQATPVNP